MLEQNKKYWLHRISHMSEISYPLLEKGYLSIGFADFLRNPNFLENMENCELDRWELFEKENLEIWGAKYRTRNSLWRFICEFKQGDWVVVPSWGVFSVYEILDKPIFAGAAASDDLISRNGKRVICGGEDDRYLYYDDGSLIDIGFVIPIKSLGSNLTRTEYAENRLLSRMKIRQTNADISDLGSEIQTALTRYKAQTPINPYLESINRMSESLKEVIDRFISPNQFEYLIKSYFEKIGADEVSIPAKTDGDGIADCDVVARFDSLKLYIFCQAKHHSGTTSEYAVEQIKEYSNPRNRKSYCEESDFGYSSIAWVISEADEFSRAALEMATKSNVRLINGTEFRKMILDVGLAKLDGFAE